MLANVHAVLILSNERLPFSEHMYNKLQHKSMGALRIAASGIEDWSEDGDSTRLEAIDKFPRDLGIRDDEDGFGLGFDIGPIAESGQVWA